MIFTNPRAMGAVQTCRLGGGGGWLGLVLSSMLKISQNMLQFQAASCVNLATCPPTENENWGGVGWGLYRRPKADIKGGEGGGGAEPPPRKGWGGGRSGGQGGRATPPPQTTKYQAKPTGLERPFRAPQRGRASHSSDFERPSEAEERPGSRGHPFAMFFFENEHKQTV